MGPWNHLLHRATVGRLVDRHAASPSRLVASVNCGHLKEMGEQVRVEENVVTTRPVRLPGPDHPISIVLNPRQVIVKVAGRVVAETREALTLSEAGYPPVQYIPRKDIDFTLLERSDHATYCPYKGDCAYYSVPVGGARSKNAAWSYETPHPAVEPIKGYVAFYRDRVDSIE
jgi:uncharacterized protein (DUF427 family)